MNVHAPIGIFDSGLGGLSVAAEIRACLPAERIIYAADNLYCPYGTRTCDEIERRTMLIAESLVRDGVKMLVVACNTATAIALEALRAAIGLPIVGLEPAVKPAIGRSQNGVIGILATPRTAASDRLRRLVDAHSGPATVVRIVAAPGLVELVEAGETDERVCAPIVRRYVQPLRDAGADTIVLGCTHYPFLRNVIQDIAGPHVAVIDSGAAIARRVTNLLDHNHGHAPIGIGSFAFRTTGDVRRVSEVVHRLWHEPVRVDTLALAHETALPKLSSTWVSSSSGLA